MRCQVAMQLGRAGQHGSVNTGPRFQSAGSLGTHRLSPASAASISQAAWPLQQVEVDSTCRTHRSSTDRGPPLGVVKGFQWTPYMPRAESPKQACRPVVTVIQKEGQP